MPTTPDGVILDNPSGPPDGVILDRPESGPGSGTRVFHHADDPAAPDVDTTDPLKLSGVAQPTPFDPKYYAAQDAASSPAGEARKRLQVSRDLGIPPTDMPENTKPFEQIRKQEEVQRKISQLPRVQEYMLRSPYHAAAIADEIDKWGTLDYVFGRYVPDSHAFERSQAAMRGEKVGQDMGYYEPPGWVLASGRAMYSTGTSIESWAQFVWGGGKSIEKIKAQQDIADAPVPGDGKPVLGKVNSLVGMAPLIVAGMVNPAAALAMVYTETSGRAYEGLRLKGYEHQEAAHIANAIGFATGYLAHVMGPMFQSEVLPIATKGSLVGLSNPFMVSLTKSPTAWNAVLGLGKNVAWNVAMNITMASMEAHVVELADSARSGKPYDYSKAVSAGAQAANSWAEMVALSVAPAYEAHSQRKALHPVGQEIKAIDAREKMAAQVYQNYEERGRALRSMHAASEIVAAVDALRDSKFMKENPEDARELIQSLVKPRESQTVYVKPEILQKMPADKLARLGNPDLSLGVAGGNVPVDLVNFLTHPDAESLLPHTAGGPDLLTLREATGVDLSTPPAGAMGQGIQDAQLDAYLEQERARNGDRTQQPRMPTQHEILNGVQQAVHGARRPAPDLGPGPSAQRVAPPPLVPETREALKTWAEDAVSRQPAKELQGLADQHEALRDKHAQQALTAQEAATMHAEAGRSPDEAQRMSRESQRRANMSGALHKAAAQAIKEVEQIGKALAEVASDPPDGSPSGRDRAWAAGEVYGAAQDAILENLGLTRKRGYAAPDVSDVQDHLLVGRYVPPGEEFDLLTMNKLLRSPNDAGDLTLVELREVNKTLRQIAAGVDSENSVRYNGIRVAKGMIAQEVSEHLRKLPDKPPGQRMHADADLAEQHAGKTAAGLAAMLNQPHTLMFKLGKFGDDLWFEHFVPGVFRENKLWGDLRPQLKEISDNTPEAIRKSGEDVVPELGGAPPKWGIRKRSDVWHLALHLGTAGTAEKIAHGLSVTPEALLEWVHGNLGATVNDAHVVMKQMIEPHWKLFDGLWTEYERHFKERGIAPPEKLQPQKMTIWGKEYSGGYGGRLQWLDKQNAPILHPGSLEALLDTGAGGPVTPRPHLNERDPDFSGRPMLNWDGVAESMKKEVHDIALRGFIEDAHKIFSDGEISGLIGDKLGREAMKQIYNPRGEGDWLHVVARGTVSDISSAEWFTRGVMKLQGYAAYSAFSLNTKVMLGQFSHLVAAMPGLALGPVEMSMGTSAAFNADRRAWAHGQSETLRLRYQDFQARSEEMIRQMTGIKAGTGMVRSATDRLNWAAWREMDGFLSHAIWEAAYAKATGDYQVGGKVASHDEAVRFADKAVTMMMPAQDVYDHSAFVRDRSMAGMSFLVKNFPNTLINVHIMNWWDSRVGGGGAMSKAGVAARYVGMVMAAEILGKGYLMHLGPKDSDDEEEWLKERMIEGLFYPVMLSGPALAAYHAAQGQPHKARQDMTRMMPPSMSIVSQGIADIGDVVLNGDDDAGLRAAAHLLGLITKSPIPGKIYDAFNAAENADDVPDAVQKGMGYRR